jgi:hypothetical protein
VKAISAYIRAILVLLWILVLKMWLTHLTFLASLLVRKFLHHQLVMAVRVLDPATVRVVILVAVNVAGLVAVLQNEAEDHVPDHLVAVTGHLELLIHEFVHGHDPRVADVTGPTAVIGRAIFVIYQLMMFQRFHVRMSVLFARGYYEMGYFRPRQRLFERFSPLASKVPSRCNALFWTSLWVAR